MGAHGAAHEARCISVLGNRLPCCGSGGPCGGRVVGQRAPPWAQVARLDDRRLGDPVFSLCARRELICQVSDFGLSRGVALASDSEGHEHYYRSTQGLFPIRWTSPEAAASMRFTVASDVWSFGIFAVEVFLDGGQPYSGVRVEVLLEQIDDGMRHHAPRLAPKKLYTEVMLKCWDKDPAARPSFEQLTKTITTGLTARWSKESGKKTTGPQNPQSPYSLSRHGGSLESIGAGKVFPHKQASGGSNTYVNLSKPLEARGAAAASDKMVALPPLDEDASAASSSEDAVLSQAEPPQSIVTANVPGRRPQSSDVQAFPAGEDDGLDGYTPAADVLTGYTPFVPDDGSKTPKARFASGGLSVPVGKLADRPSATLRGTIHDVRKSVVENVVKLHEEESMPGKAHIQELFFVRGSVFCAVCTVVLPSMCAKQQRPS